MNVSTTWEKKTGKVYLHVTFKGSRFKVCTGLQSDEPLVGGMVFAKTQPYWNVKTARLARFVSDADEYLLRNFDESLDNVRDGIKYLVTGVKPKKRPEKRKFADYIEDFASTRGKSTGEVYHTTAQRVRAYDNKCTFDTINKNWLEAYQRNELNRGRTVNGVAIDLRNMRAVFNWAIDNEWTSNYPFRKFAIKSERTKHLFLPADEIKRLRDYKVEPYQEVYRDLFMLGFYLIGINISDLLELKKVDMRFGRITFHRNKTHRLYDIKVEPEAQAIIDKYKGKEHLLRFLDDGCKVRTFTHNINDALKKIGEMKITRNKRGSYCKKVIDPLFPDIVWYTGRRSWATIAASLDIPKETIGKALGHSVWDSTVTDIYINFDNKKIDEANRKVLDALK